MRPWDFVKKAKEFYDWYSFGSNILGIFGATGVISGLAAFVVGMVGGAVRALPWPFLVMGGYCTLVAASYAALIPFFIGSVKKNSGTIVQHAREPQRPVYAAWKHVEKFTLREAAYLWVDIEPNSNSKSVEVAAWIDAFCAAVRTGRIRFIPVKIGDVSGHRRLEFVNHQKDSADADTIIPRDSLLLFAKENNCKPKFLEDELLS